MAITLLVLLTVFFVEYFPDLHTSSFIQREIEEQKRQDMTVKRPLQKPLVIRSVDDVIENKKEEKTKSIVIDNGRENQMWVYLSKEKSNVMPKSSGMLNIQILESVSGMSNSLVVDEAADSSDEDESLETEDDSLSSETSIEIALSSEEERSEYLFDKT